LTAVGAPPSGDAAKSPFDVSVIIVSWNVKAFLHRCIESVLATTDGLSREIIVVDNASSDGSPEMVRRDFPQVRLIETGANLGFGRANNLGLTYVRGRYVLFLNPDTVVEDGALPRMVNVLDEQGNVGVVGPRLIGADGAVQYASARTGPTVRLTIFDSLYLHRLPFVGPALRKRLISPYDLDVSQEVEVVSGAAMLVRRPLVEQVGGFDEVFLHTAEDVDLCLRLRERGAQVVYRADARVVHFGGESTALAFVHAGTAAFISTYEYFLRWHGRLSAELYRFVVRGIQMPTLLLVGAGKSLASRDTTELRSRWRFAKVVWTWRPKA